MKDPRKLPARIYAAVDRMISAAEADKLGAIVEADSLGATRCVYRLTNPGDGRDECFCAIGVQLSPHTLDRIEASGANKSSVGSAESRAGISVFSLIGLTVDEAAAFQELHDSTYKAGKRAGTPRADTNKIYIERLRGYVEGTYGMVSQDRVVPLDSVVDFGLT
jgi:hypothetical protein